jgi:hypothetical protein
MSGCEDVEWIGFYEGGDEPLDSTIRYQLLNGFAS